MSGQHGNFSSSFSLSLYWRHSVAVAAIAESIARHLRRYDPIEPDEVFSAAIMHDIGKLVMAGYEPAVFDSYIAESSAKNVPLWQIEKAPLSHAWLGRQIAEHWHYPKDITGAIAEHHEPTNSGPFGKLIGVVHIADAMAHAVGFRMNRGEAMPAPNAAVLASMPLPLERFKIIAEEVIRREAEFDSLLGSFT